MFTKSRKRDLRPGGVVTVSPADNDGAHALTDLTAAISEAALLAWRHRNPLLKYRVVFNPVHGSDNPIVLAAERIVLAHGFAPVSIGSGCTVYVFYRWTYECGERWLFSADPATVPAHQVILEVDARHVMRIELIED